MTRTGEHEAIDVEERPRVTLQLKLLGLGLGLLATAAGAGAGWVALRDAVADAQTRVSTVELRVDSLEKRAAGQDVINQRVADDLDHIRQVTDQTARDVRALQGH